MSINDRVRATSNSVVCDSGDPSPKAPDPTHIREVYRQIDVPTSLTPDLGHFHFVCCVKEVCDLINRPVVSLNPSVWYKFLGCPQTHLTEISKFPATTLRKRSFLNQWDVVTNGRDEGLSEVRI